ncbi:peptidoglycan DD-metalloendopeptidase family protein [Candidatus Entotheonella palauensis]|uniref:peptidoglycan DD-metalloendopeptidase family protein n=1 Tax=Candidatus Entotheonella palauensis TaxID=93172 RepID=UPI000B7E183D|nr:M23 family metallopeptidase [Candidatus Entotheonella palauensis]
MSAAIDLSVLIAGLCVCLLLAGCGGAERAVSPRASKKGVYHQVKPGQTLWSIARAYQVDIKTLTRANRLSNRDVLRVGQRLLIPGARRQRRVVSRCPCPDKPTKTAARTAKKKSPRAASKRSAVAKRPSSSMQLSWPIRGTITRRFNRSGRQRHDGIDIAAPRGATIRAAAAGKVIFSDWGPGGYGRLVIVQHTSNLVTVYAHNERNLVKRNQRVNKGQAIATVGRSGRATGYHLHFEVRFKTVPKPPFTFLPQQRQAGIQSPEGGKVHSTIGIKS